jgi:hypothetical protein
MKRGQWLAGLAAGLLLLGAAEARSASVTGSMGGGEGCTDSACFYVTLMQTSSGTFQPGSVFNIDTTTVSFDMTLASVRFTPFGSPSDNGVTQLDLTGVRYVGSANYNPSNGAMTGGTASISGLATPTGAGSAANFSVTGVPVSGDCNGATCFLMVGPSSGYAILINEQTRYFANTLNFTVPEASSLFLLGLGLGALIARRSLGSA